MSSRFQAPMSPPRPAVAGARSWEWPTIGVALVLYGGFGLLTWYWQDLPVWLVAPVGTVLLAWHGSLQHETIHDHPTPFRRLNALLGAPPLALWLPYGLYRETHLGHHRHTARDLTDPDMDPESYYLRPGALAGATRLKRLFLHLHATLAGRLSLGPAVLIARCWIGEAHRFAGDRSCRRIWWRHCLAVGLVVVWANGVCHIPIAAYLGLMVYPSISLGLLRSFVEHRAAPDPQHRTAVVEAGPFWGLLFLNNNLHVVHHRHPGLPWYRLPAAWRALRPTLEMAPALLFPGGYAEIFVRYLFVPTGPIEHPGAGTTS